MAGCLFCRIAQKEIPSIIVYENKSIIAFKDINPQAPIHILIVPKKHVESLSELTASGEPLACEILDAASEISRDQNVDKSGFRLIANYGPDSGQEIAHLHFHLLGGRRLGRLVEKVIE